MKFFSKKAIKVYLKLLLVFSLLFMGYYYSPYKLEFLGHYSKVLAHRCNSVERLNSALKYYKGVELDLVYYKDTDVLDVNHPPSPSSQLNFVTYIDSLKKGKQPILWLDIKNLKEENALFIFNRISTILINKKYDFSKILIETRYPEALPIFTKAGFKTSFYLPKKLHLKSAIELKKSIDNISVVLENQPKIGISTNLHDYEVLNTFFPNKTKYIWTLAFPLNKYMFLTNKILKDSTVEIVLTKFNTLQGNK